MRVHPWHTRQPTPLEYRWYKNLVDLHDLTRAWVVSSQPMPGDPVNPQQEDAPPQTKGEDVLLQALPQARLEDLLENAWITPFLENLDRTIWELHAWALTHQQRSTPLDLLSKQHGSECAKDRWPHAPPASCTQDLRNLLLCLNDTPMLGFPLNEGFLIKRATRLEVQVELRRCPHQHPYNEVHTVSDLMCGLHTKWMEGFLSFLNPSVRVEYETRSPRCTQRWYIAS